MAITATRAAGTRPGRTRSPLVARQRRRQAIVAWGFCLPFVAVFAVFMLVPLVSSFAMSFTDFRATDIRSPFAVDFTGLDQYAKLFTDATFLRSIGVTAFFVVVGIPVTMVIALALALALNSGRGRIVSFFRVGFYAPVVTSIVAVSVVWRYILLPDGLLNSALAVVGITGPNWLSERRGRCPRSS